jgi:hypothetical protein
VERCLIRTNNRHHFTGRLKTRTPPVSK